MATPIFVGRTRVLEKARAAISGGLHIHLTGEAGTGKTALARRLSPGAVFVEHPTPPSDVLATLLLHAHTQGWWTPPPASSRSSRSSGDDDDDDLDEGALVKIIRKMGQKTAVQETVAAYRAAPSQPVIVFDDFDTAPAGVVRMVRALSECATIVAVGSQAPRAHQKPFLFSCVSIEIKRLSAKETEELVLRLLEPHPVRSNEKARLVRHLVEESQGLPSVVHELVKRGVARGDLSLPSLRRESGINGFKTIDMTPGLALLFCLLMISRGLSRGMGDMDLRIAFAMLGGLMMIGRFLLFRSGASRSRSR